MEIFSQMLALVRQQREIVSAERSLAEESRRQLIALQGEACRLSKDYDQKAAAVPGKMMAATRDAWMTKIFGEFTPAFPLADKALDIKQFDGSLTLTTDRLSAGQPFVLRIRLRNTGVYAWQPEAGRHPQLRLGGDAARLGLPAQCDYADSCIVFGDQREIELHGLAPQSPGKATITATLHSPFNFAAPIIRKTIALQWD